MGREKRLKAGRRGPRAGVAATPAERDAMRRKLRDMGFNADAQVEVKRAMTEDERASLPASQIATFELVQKLTLRLGRAPLLWEVELETQRQRKEPS